MSPLLLFASAAEVIFAALMLLPLVFFAACALYLLRLTAYAAMERRRVVDLPRPEVGDISGSSTASDPAECNPAENGVVANSALKEAQKETRFTLLIPAHNEELLLGAALSALQRLQYPRSLYEIVVIADNCTDRTASIARESGALALERFDAERVGKGYALEDTLAWLLSESKREAAQAKTAAESAGNEKAIASNDSAETSAFEKGGLTLRSGPSEAGANTAWQRAGRFDAVVVLDADTLVSPNLLAVFATALQNGQTIVQARYDVLNADDSWRTRLMRCALALAHVVKPLGRERLKLSDGLKGNGMCFAREVVVAVPWSGESITEDIEYTLRVCTMGYRVAFVPEACVWAQMPTTGAQAASQRQRWEGGRYRLLFQVAPRLLSESVRTRNRPLCDRAIELIVPPFAEMFALPALLGGLCALLARLCGWLSAGLLAEAWALILVLQAVYLFGGMWVARMPARVVLSLLFAPLYIVWKLGLYAIMAVGRSAVGWKRTERHELSSK